MSEERIVLITGGSSGIGRACARRLSERRYRVFAAARSLEDGPLSDLQHGLRMNIDDEDSVRAGVERVLDRTGRLDAVVNVAGFGIGGSIEDTSIDEAKAIFETNFFGILRVCRATLPTLRRQRSGRIVNVSSLAGRIGLPFQGLYSATKFAIEGLSESLRMELKPFGIHVSLIEPGDFNTGFTANRRVVDGGQSGAYGARFRRALAVAESDETGGASPDHVARLLGRILRARSPRLRYSVGPPSQRTASVLKGLLPSSVFEREIMRHYDVL